MQNNILDLLIQIDEKILIYINSLRNPWTDPLILFITYFGLPYIWLILLFVMIRKSENKKIKILFYIVMYLSVVLSNISIKYIIMRPRPNFTNILGPVETSPSFPSGHTSNSWAGAFAITLLIKQEKQNNSKIPVISYIIATLVSFSRMYIGVHYPSDVIAAFLESWIIILLWKYMVILLTDSTYLISPFENKIIIKIKFIIKWLLDVLYKIYLLVIDYYRKIKLYLVKLLEYIDNKELTPNNKFKLYVYFNMVIIFITIIIMGFAFTINHFRDNIFKFINLLGSSGEFGYDEINDAYSDLLQFSVAFSLIFNFIIGIILYIFGKQYFKSFYTEKN